MGVSYSTLGNAALMDLPKVSFLSSRKISPEAVLASHAWATKCRDEGGVVIGGFQSELEKDVLRFLLRGACPIVIVEARKPRKVVPTELRDAFNANRILFVSLPEVKNARVGETVAMQRNRFVLAHSNRHVFGSVDPSGKLASEVAALHQKSVEVLA